MPNVLKQFGEKVTGSLSGRFHHARVRLTLIYMGILVAILFISSYTIYSNFSGRLEHRFDRVQQPSFQQMYYQPTQGQGFAVPRPEDVKGDLVHTLIIVNGLLLLLAGAASYGLAGLTLEPIQAAYDRQRRFLGDASHELRTPLAILQTDLENELEDEKVKGANRERAESHLEEVDRMGRLVSDLLVLSRLDEDGVSKKEVRNFDLGVILEEVVSKLKVTANRHNVALEYFPVSEDHFEVLAEKEALLGVFTNIIKNAIIYNQENGKVQVTLYKEGESIKVKVADSGIGIAKKDIDQIFDRFYRADHSRSRQTGGSGLGLSIVRSSLDRLHGTLSIQSQLGKGTTVVIALPHSRPS